MPYRTTAKLPESVKLHLPRQAQEIYRAVFNHAWKEYSARRDREALAHRVAWAAVKRRYRKFGQAWVKK
jgi:cation transport regulator